MNKQLNVLMKRTERIISVALEGYGLIYSLPAPQRHHHIIHALYKLTGKSIGGDYQQGFITNIGRFVNRTEGYEIAKDAEQLLDLPHVPHTPGTLYSEDLW